VKVAESIAHMEGYGVPGARPTRNNNPGDIEFGPFAQRHGATGGDPRFAIFPSPDAGMNCLRALLLGRYSGLTVAAALNKYAPPIENHTNAYIAGVCRMTGLTPETVITADNI
jgi:hypothetical protein